MVKRTLAGILWLFAAWSVWTIIAYAAGWPGTLGVVVGAAAAGFVVVDPFGRIWKRELAVQAPHAEPEPA